ncbi:MAG: zf-HC2 domain-containing protein [Myxococcales bacterium]|nr:zf-HC2 domain-containing protein [Myxococcales bacterium]
MDLSTCRHIIEELLSGYVDGELPPRTAQQLELHMQACPPCAAFLRTFMASRQARPPRRGGRDGRGLRGLAVGLPREGDGRDGVARSRREGLVLQRQEAHGKLAGTQGSLKP